jgi:hypothetical protein
MLLPAIDSCVYVQMAKRTAVRSRKRFGRKTLFLLNVSFVVLLVHCFFTSRAFLVILTIGAFSNQMGSKGTDLDSLATLAADNKHWASIEVMHVFVIFFNKPFVYSFAELALLIFVD